MKIGALARQKGLANSSAWEAAQNLEADAAPVLKEEEGTMTSVGTLLLL